jgi:hypothetical protein
LGLFSAYDAHESIASKQQIKSVSRRTDHLGSTKKEIPFSLFTPTLSPVSWIRFTKEAGIVPSKIKEMETDRHLMAQRSSFRVKKKKVRTTVLTFQFVLMKKHHLQIRQITQLGRDVP